MDYLCNCDSEIATVCNAMESHYLRAMKVVHHHANGRFDWLISGHQSVNPSRKAISVMSGKHKRFQFVHPVQYHILDCIKDDYKPIVLHQDFFQIRKSQKLWKTKWTFPNDF